MPIVRIEMLPGRAPETKAAIARAITQVMQDIGGAGPESTSVIFTDIAPGDWMIGGRMLSDRNEAGS
ncbi:4-oxalocrotonate tautomerase family protein [Paracoccus sp. (in: a-proteobacteria)]|uniref:tautomerase family protein n=1 Tax=Paracoccus sp. TaxID=267 RepID=UPI0035AF6666